ncbi:MAG: rhodanese-related sulfurtransferase [SAR86 cluster bacterium]|jgi:UPF0176 protein|nr:rhodanese-related sulfurtransferase [SAR86 cluster bacterium]
MELIAVITFYKIFFIKDVYKFSRSIERVATKENILGTFFVTPEGINTTLSGSANNLQNFLIFLENEHKIPSELAKWTKTASHPFKRLKVRIKDRLLPLEGDFQIIKKRGKHIAPEGWNELLQDPDVILLDVRNEYEISLGTFKTSINPMTSSFINFPEFLESIKGFKEKKFAMFCTGGIRCEVASAYMMHKGYKEVFQLEGGILNYIERVKAEDHLWQGECFVFDERVSVDKNLLPGNYSQCFGCRRPLSKKDMKSRYYVKGVSCHLCFDETSENDKLRFRERQKQIELAAMRGINHFGGQKI